MTLHVHRAERADALAAALAELLSRPLDDVFAGEVVAVPARGVERWLTQRMSHQLGSRPGRADGICAAVRFPSPAALLAEIAGAPDADPWAPDVAVWPLLDVLDECSAEPWCRALARHLGYAGEDREALYRRDRRYAVARRVVGLFDGYALHRPDMLAAWVQRDDQDGWGATLPADMAWQPELWRRLIDRIDAPDPVARMSGIVDVLTDDPASVDLPQRISLFGPTALPQRQFRVLTALARHRDVHLWLPHPSPALWSTLQAAGPGQAVPRKNDPSAGAAQHPLLSSLGRDSREMQHTIASAPHTDTHHAAALPTGTLLARLQADLRDNLRPGGTRHVLHPGDDSIRVHACHGRSRQVDVLLDVVIGLLAADVTLRPSDILVMCPDIEAYAPLVQGSFGLDEVVDGGHPAHGLWVRLADRALSQTNPLLSTVEKLLDLADGRVSASQVLDLAAWGPVRRRFRFDDDELERLSAWAAESGARWGLDGPHRAAFGLRDFPQNTWQAGVDRVLLGVAMAEEDNSRLDTALPLDDVGSSDVDLAGRLAELLARLTVALDSLTGARPVGGWVAALIAAVDSLTGVTTSTGWQSAELRRELADVEQNATAAGAQHVALTRSDVRALLAGRLAGRPTRANFRTGTLTVCTMVPMRSVPHRVVCLLGLDDGVVPRAAREDGDNVLARRPAVGERDPRSEDRQLFLDALLAATDTVVITYTGADERTNARQPPAVPLGELLDTLDDTAVTEKGAPARDQVLIRHPLQPFDARTVTPGELGRTGPFTFDRAALEGALAAANPRLPVPAFLPAPLPALPPGDVDLDRLIALLTHPAKGFLRQRLDVGVRFDDDEPSDAMPVELNALERWGVGNRLLRDRLAGIGEDDCRQAEWRRGVLPPGRLGANALEAVLADVRPLIEGTQALRALPRRTADVTATLAGGRQVRGTVGGVHGSILISVSYSKLPVAARLRAWITLLALTVSAPGTLWGAATVGRGEVGRPACATLEPINADRAAVELGRLVQLFDQGLTEPLPMPVKTAAEYARVRFRGDDPVQAQQRAATTWTGSNFPGESDDGAYQQVWGREAPFGTLLAGPGATRGAAPGPDGEPHRFGSLAVGLWFPLLQHEKLGAL